MISLPASAFAHSNGAATEGCGCHSGGQTPTVLITPDLPSINPGQLVTLTVSVSTTNGNAAGFFLESSVGHLSIVDAGTKLLGNGVTHAAPRVGSGGSTTFKVGWTAPDAPGSVDFRAWGNSVNSDHTQRGDAGGMAFFSAALGCAGTKYYHDYDSDGVGATASGYTVACSTPQYYSEKSDDCDDNDAAMFPGNPELCDGKDNNCNGQIDEGFPTVTYCTDADGDGHGVLGKATAGGCTPPRGFGLCDSDCNDSDPTTYPGAPELCDGKDNNCNGQIDEGARAECGLGWCARYADSCTSTNCTPGTPRAEVCNGFDDDCDGVADNGTNLELCGRPGLACRAGLCVTDPNAASEAPMPNVGASNGRSISGSGGGADASGGTLSSEASSRAADTSNSPGCTLIVGSARKPPVIGAVALVLAVILQRKRRRHVELLARARLPTSRIGSPAS